MKLTLKKIVKSLVPYGVLWIYRKIHAREQSPQSPQKLEFVFTLMEDCPTEISSSIASKLCHALVFTAPQDYPVYGQCGEDMLLRIFSNFDENYNGFYVDIGAYDPISASNTKYFYDHGWHGINIDANPVSIAKFNKTRERDINIESGVSDEYSELEYYYFGETSSINTFNKDQAKAFEKQFNTRIQEIKKIKVQPINNILEENLCGGGEQHIDFITLDVEGFEMRILESFDFEKYAPDYFLVEDLGYNGIENFKTSPLYKLLNGKGYKAVGKTSLTVLFKKIMYIE